MLSNIRIVLVNTSHPGNIGAVARAMKNMCLSQLYLVEPQRFPDREAEARACGADDILENAVVCDDLDEAIGDCALVFGASARKRTLSWPEVTPRLCCEKAAEFASSQPVAILFGREDAGLTNDELERCHYMIKIPSNSEYSSLNIAAAVQVIAYELHVYAALPTNDVIYEPDCRVASSVEMEGFYEHLERTMVKTGFLGVGEPRNVIRRMRRMFNRVHVDENEMNILRGMLSATDKAVTEKQ